MAQVILKNISKSYGNMDYAVKDVNIEIKDKEFIALVGPSGCGKSTTLRMIAGLENISSGEIYIENRNVNNIQPKDRDIAMVFQSYALYPHLSVYENIAFSMKLKKDKKYKIENKVNEVAQILGLENILNKKPRELSGGQRQRVALGRAIVRNPKVFLMDEPLSNLDAKLRSSMRSEIIKLHKKLQTTFIYVTHDQIEAMTMADRIVVMKDGVIQQIDTPQKIYDNPKNLFVASFIGVPQINLIDCIVEEIKNYVYLKFNNFRMSLEYKKSELLRKKGYIGKEIILGIRPEDIYIKDSINKETINITEIMATVELREFMGAEAYLHLNIDEKTIISRVNSKVNLNCGEKVDLYIDNSKVHLFDKKTKNLII